MACKVIKICFKLWGNLEKRRGFLNVCNKLMYYHLCDEAVVRTVSAHLQVL